MVMGKTVAKCNVEICTDYVTKDPKEVERILNRVSEIISRSYQRRMLEGEEL